MITLQTPESQSEVRRVLSPYFELAADFPSLVVTAPRHINNAGTSYPLVKVRLLPETELGPPRGRVLVITGATAEEASTTDAAFHATLRLLRNRKLQSTTEWVLLPLADPVHLANAGLSTQESDVRRSLVEQLSEEAYDALIVLRSNKHAEEIQVHVAPNGDSRSLAFEVMRGEQHRPVDPGKFLPLGPDALLPRGANTNAACVHLELPTPSGSERTLIAAAGADWLLEALQACSRMRETRAALAV